MSKLLDAAYKVGAPFEEVIEKLLAKAPGTLDNEEKAFLRARRDHITDEQAEVYGIDDEVEAEKSPERIALEEEATALGVSFTDKTKDAALQKKVDEAKA